MENSVENRSAGRASLLTLALFIVVVLGVGIAIGFATPPGEWYRALEKPVFNPPNWLFGPVWTAIYILIAVAGWRIYCRAPKSQAMTMWFAQLALNWAWSPVFFGLEAIWPAFIVIVALWISIVAFIIRAKEIDGVATILFMPYLAWVSFALVLNLAIGILN